MKVINGEFFKLLRRKDIYVYFLILIGLAFLFAFLMGTDSSIFVIQGLDKMGGMFFTVFVYNFLAELLLLPLIIAATVSGIWACEFGNGTIAYIINASSTRFHIFVSKSALAFGCGMLFVAVLLGCSILFYETIGKAGSFYTSDFMNTINGELATFLLMIFLMILFTCSLTTLLSMMGNQIKTILVYLVILIFMRILEQIEAVSRFVPSRLYNASNPFDPDWTDKGLSVVIVMVLSGVMYAAAYFIFKKKNID